MTAEQLGTLVETSPLGQILREYPIAGDFFLNFRLELLRLDVPLAVGLGDVQEDILEEFGLDRSELIRRFCAFLETLLPSEQESVRVENVTILGGRDKSGRPESVELTIHAGEVISIVGPTGSGKSRLLGDIECLAQRDTPTGRLILVNGERLNEEQRFNMGGKLVAQLSQNMNFVMDLGVGDFLAMHAGSRMVRNIPQIVEQCFACANDLAGEPFSLETKITQLSGGQSRALMIADTACMSSSPIVLIDEIENAGVDRRRAIQLLAKKEKIVLVSTHDPLLALSAGKRIIIKNGGIHRVLETTPEERGSLDILERLDAVQSNLRRQLRSGMRITEDMASLRAAGLGG